MTRWPLLTLATLWITLGRRPPKLNRTNHLERAVDCYPACASSPTRALARFSRPILLSAAGALCGGLSLPRLAKLPAQLVAPESVILLLHQKARLTPRAAGFTAARRSEVHKRPIGRRRTRTGTGSARGRAQA
jgi:hypothetical protein